MTKKTFRNLLIVLFIILVPIISVLGAVRLTAFNMYFYESQFNKYEPNVDNAIEITAGTLYYLKESSAGENYISDYTLEEQAHLVEVKSLVQKGMWLLYGSIAAILIITVLLYFTNKRDYLVNLSMALFYGGGFSAIMISLFLFLVSIGFDSVFTYFHYAFFTTTWQFPATSLLIKLFPRMFFVDVIIKIIIGAYVASMFFNFAGFYIVKREKYLSKKK